MLCICFIAFVPACARTKVPKIIDSVPDRVEAIPTPSAPIEKPQITMKSVEPKTDNKAAVMSSPPDLLIPKSSESARIPFDFAIGLLGKGDASQSAYKFAKNFLEGMSSGSNDVRNYLEEAKKNEVERSKISKALLGLSVRIGGGLQEQDGLTSFLFRAIGKESSFSGELHLMQHEGSWYVDDLIVDDASPNLTSEGSSTFDPFSYKRFL